MKKLLKIREIISQPSVPAETSTKPANTSALPSDTEKPKVEKSSEFVKPSSNVFDASTNLTISFVLFFLAIGFFIILSATLLTLQFLKTKQTKYLVEKKKIWT